MAIWPSLIGCLVGFYVCTAIGAGAARVVSAWHSTVTTVGSKWPVAVAVVLNVGSWLFVGVVVFVSWFFLSRRRHLGPIHFLRASP
jgi:hypothetical protein